MFLPPEDANYLQYPYNYNHNTNPITDTMRFSANDFSSVRNPKIAQYKLWEGAYLDTPAKSQYINLVSPIETGTNVEWVKPTLNKTQELKNGLLSVSKNLSRFATPLLEPLTVYGGLQLAVDAAKRSDDRIPVGDVPSADFDTITFNQKQDGTMLPFIQIGQDGIPQYTLQGGVNENYILPPSGNQR